MRGKRNGSSLFHIVLCYSGSSSTGKGEKKKGTRGDASAVFMSSKTEAGSVLEDPVKEGGRKKKGRKRRSVVPPSPSLVPKVK